MKCINLNGLIVLLNDFRFLKRTIITEIFKVESKSTFSILAIHVRM